MFEIIAEILFNLRFCPASMLINLRSVNVPYYNTLVGVGGYADMGVRSITILGKNHNQNNYYNFRPYLLNNEIVHINGTRCGGVPRKIKREWVSCFKNYDPVSLYSQDLISSSE